MLTFHSIIGQVAMNYRIRQGSFSEKGASMLEASMLIALIAVAALAALRSTGGNSALTIFVVNAGMRGAANNQGQGGQNDSYTGKPCYVWARDHAKFCNTKYGLDHPACFGEGLVNALDHRCPT